MKIKVNKEKLKAAIEKRLTEKEGQYKEELASFEKKKQQRDIELLSFFRTKIEQIKTGTFDESNGQFGQYEPISIGSGFIGRSYGPILPQKPQFNNREEQRLLAQLAIMEEASIEIDDHSDYFRYI